MEKWLLYVVGQSVFLSTASNLITFCDPSSDEKVYELLFIVRVFLFFFQLVKTELKMDGVRQTANRGGGRKSKEKRKYNTFTVYIPELRS